MTSTACSYFTAPTGSPSSPDAGAEGMQEAGNVSVFYGSYTWRLHYQPCVQLGGPSGPECLPTARQPGSKPEARTQHGGEDGKNNLCLVCVVVKKKRDKNEQRISSGFISTEKKNIIAGL